MTDSLFVEGLKYHKNLVLTMLVLFLFISGSSFYWSHIQEVKCKELVSQLDCSEVRTRLEISHYKLEGCWGVAEFTKADNLKEKYLDECLEVWKWEDLK